MNIPISLSYKYFEETITVKKKVKTLHIRDTLEMYKNIIVPIYGQEHYEDAIISLANKICREKYDKVSHDTMPHEDDEIYKF